MSDGFELADGAVAYSSEDIRALIRRKHTSYDHRSQKEAVDGILIFELATWTGHAVGEPSRIDAWHMTETLSTGLRRTSYEIKVSRADFLRELREPKKRRAALRVSNQYFFVTPPGIAKVEEVPIECGLLEVAPGGKRLTAVIDAPFRDGHGASWHFFAAFARRVLKTAELEERGE